jgi:hypothetical protein
LAKLDPEFVRQLDEAQGQEAVQAVVRLQPSDHDSAVVVDPEETDRMARELVDRVKESSGSRDAAINVFRNLGSFAISASADFLRALARQPEVAAVVANRQPGSALIPPAGKRPASLRDVGRRGRPSANARLKKSRVSEKHSND